MMNPVVNAMPRSESLLSKNELLSSAECDVAKVAECRKLQSEMTVLQKIKSLVVNIFKFSITAALFTLNEIPFTLGFAVGIVASRAVKVALTTFNDICRTQTRGTLTLLGVMAFLGLPVTLGMASFAVGASISSKMARDAEKILNHQPIKHKPYWYLWP